MNNYNPNLIVPTDIVQAAYKVKVFLDLHGGASVAGIGDVHTLQRQLDEITLRAAGGKMKTYALADGKLAPDEKGIWTLRCNADVLRAELDQVARELDQLKALLAAADALHNHERGL